MAVRELRPSSGRREVLRGGAAAPGSLGHEPLAAQRPEEAQLALSLAQHPDEHRPRRLVLLEVDQRLTRAGGSSTQTCVSGDGPGYG